MLSPEIWDFPVLSPQIRNSYCNSDEEIFSKIKKQLFNHHVSIDNEIILIFKKISQLFKSRIYVVKFFF